MYSRLDIEKTLRKNGIHRFVIRKAGRHYFVSVFGCDISVIEATIKLLNAQGCRAKLTKKKSVKRIVGFGGGHKIGSDPSSERRRRCNYNVSIVVVPPPPPGPRPPLPSPDGENSRKNGSIKASEKHSGRIIKTKYRKPMEDQ